MAQPPASKQSGKSAEDEPPPRRNWAGAVGRDTSINATAAFTRAGFTDPALVLRWNEIAGLEVARIARPVRFSAKDGVLTLLAEPAAALFLGHESRALASRINSYLGRPAVTRLKFIQGKLTQPPAPPAPSRPAESLDSGDPAIQYRGPDSLKTALKSLARWRAGTGPRHG